LGGGIFQRAQQAVQAQLDKINAKKVQANITRDFNAASKKAKDAGMSVGMQAAAGIAAVGPKFEAVGKASTGKVATSMSGAKGQATTAGHGVGAAFSSGVGAGIAVHAADAAAAQLVANAEAAARAQAGAKSPAQVTIALGKDIVAGLVKGMVDARGLSDKAAADVAKAAMALMAGEVAKGTPKVLSAARQIAGTIKSLGPMIDSAGIILGAGAVKGIIKGLIQQQPSLKTQAQQAIAQALADMRQKTIDDAGKVGDAFGVMADKALANFDARVAAWKNPISAKLQAMQDEDAAKQGTDQLASSMNDVTAGLGDSIGTTIGTDIGNAISKVMNTTITGNFTKDIAALNRTAIAAQNQVTGQIMAAAQPAIDAANAQVAEAEANLSAAQATGDADAISKAQADLDAAKGRRSALEAAIRTEVENATGQLAAATERRYGVIATKDRAGLQGQLNTLGTYLAKHPGEWTKMGNAVNKVLTDFGIKHIQPAGKSWAEKFASGVISGIPAVQRAIDRLVAAAVARIPTTASPLKPAEKGPFAFHPFDMGLQWVQAWASGMQTGGRSLTGLSFSRPSMAGASYGPAGAGSDTINVTMMLNDRIIGEATYRDLQRRGLRDVKIFAN
jgi:hypothetical protein